MKNFTICHLPGNKFKRTVRVSDSLSCHLWPSLGDLLELRSTFSQLAFGSHGVSGLAHHWVPLLSETESLIADLACDYSI